MTTQTLLPELEIEKASAPAVGRRRTREILLRWLKFNLVGGIGIAVQFAALFVLKGIFHFNYLAATAVAVEAAVVHNFVWHEQFTWSDRVQASWRRSLPRFVRFNLTTGAVSILGNLALMKVMVGYGGMNYLLANALAIALCSLANFLVSEQWVFRGNLQLPVISFSRGCNRSGLVNKYEERIIRDPQICGGDPVFKGTRVTLRTVLASLAAGDLPEAILSDFPALRPEDVQAAISFAATSAAEDLPVAPTPDIAHQGR